MYEAGSETSALFLQAFVILLATHPEMQKKAQIELDSVVGQGRLPIYEDGEKLPYVRAIVQETHRTRIVHRKYWPGLRRHREGHILRVARTTGPQGRPSECSRLHTELGLQPLRRIACGVGMIGRHSVGLHRLPMSILCWLNPSPFRWRSFRSTRLVRFNAL